FIFFDFIDNDDRKWWIFLSFRRIIRLSTPGEYGIHVLSLSLRRRRDHNGIDEKMNYGNLGFDNLHIGCNLLHDMHISACHRS
ncbi:hypothetical protein Tco_0181491, partial [Tanacetum coccineum]